ncbi:hypothetical protein Aperf_G00000074875 [Anoplocephala perfoliata]
MENAEDWVIIGGEDLVSKRHESSTEEANSTSKAKVQSVTIKGICDSSELICEDLKPHNSVQSAVNEIVLLNSISSGGYDIESCEEVSLEESANEIEDGIFDAANESDDDRTKPQPEDFQGAVKIDPYVTEQLAKISILKDATESLVKFKVREDGDEVCIPVSINTDHVRFPLKSFQDSFLNALMAASLGGTEEECPDVVRESADELLTLAVKNLQENSAKQPAEQTGEHFSGILLTIPLFYNGSETSMDKMGKVFPSVSSLPRKHINDWYNLLVRKLSERLAAWKKEELKNFATFVWKVLATYETSSDRKDLFSVTFPEALRQNEPTSEDLLLLFISEGIFAATSITLLVGLYKQDVKKCFDYVLGEYMDKFELYNRYKDSAEEDSFLLVIRQYAWDPIRDEDNPVIGRLIRKMESWDIKHSVGRMRQVFPWLQRYRYKFTKEALRSLLAITKEEVRPLDETQKQELAHYIWKRVGKHIPTYFKGRPFLVRRDYKYRVLVMGLLVEKISAQCCCTLIAEGILAWAAYRLNYHPVYGKVLEIILRKYLLSMMKQCVKTACC